MALKTRRIETQLSAIAHTADRRNRPMVVIVIAGLCMLGALGYAVASFSNMNSQGSRLVTAERTQERVRTLMAQIRAERASRLDYAEMFPQKTRFPLSVVEQANAVWPEREWTFGQLGREKPQRAVQLIENLNRVGVQLTIRGEPLDKVLELSDRILTGPEEEFGKSFLAMIDLRPTPTDDTWISLIEIDRYEYRRPR
ncbi:MAG: hypothetical protein ACTS3F_01455 [Phycisphaerales bacterium]